MSIAIKVLVADHSVEMRRLIASVIETRKGMQVVAEVDNGRAAVEAFKTSQPDVVILDLQLPVFDGVETVRKIRNLDSQVPVVMFSSATVSGGEATLKALSAGANDFVSKPMHLTGGSVITFIETDLISRITFWYERSRLRRGNFNIPPASKQTIATVAPPESTVYEAEANTYPADSKETTSATQPKVIAIGSSTGGPNALKTVLGGLSPTLSVPIVIVQHMPAQFTKMLALQLNSQCRLTVTEAKDGSVLQPGSVLLAPGGRHMTLRKRANDVVVKLNDDPPENSCRPSVDVLFRSVAEVYGRHALSVILTGMGCDGTAGCRQIKQVGGTVFSQDQQSCAAWGMPRSVEEAGLVDDVVSLETMGNRLSRTLLLPVGV